MHPTSWKDRTMSSLEQVQGAMMQALEMGPGFLPEDLFRGGRQAVLRGMKVHANTISHARLVALEDTFPITRQQMGDARFNALSRQYLARPHVFSRPLMRIGEAFPDFLNAAQSDRAVIDIASFEWEWLQSCHAADVEALALSALAGLPESALLDIVLDRHPAARMLDMDRRAQDCIGLAAPHARTAPVLITRPDAEVRIAPANEEMARTFGFLSPARSVRDLLEAASALDGKDAPVSTDPAAALIKLIEAGAVVRAIGGERDDCNLRPDCCCHDIAHTGRPDAAFRAGGACGNILALGPDQDRAGKLVHDQRQHLVPLPGGI
jgi:hypothetical protein